MASDGAEGGFALKVCLGRLLPREALRHQIERTAEALQVLAIRGSLVATTVVLEELRQGRSRPPTTRKSDGTLSCCGKGRCDVRAWLSDDLRGTVAARTAF